MSSPLGHSLAGYLISLAGCKFRTLAIRNFKVFFLVIFIANVPCLDFIPDTLAPKPKHRCGLIN